MLAAVKQQQPHESQDAGTEPRPGSKGLRQLGDSILKSTDLVAQAFRSSSMPSNETSRDDVLKTLARQREGSLSTAQVAGEAMIAHVGSGAAGLRAEQRVKDAAFLGEDLNQQPKNTATGLALRSGGVTLPPSPEAQQELHLKREGMLNDRLLRAANHCVMTDAREVALNNLPEPLKDQYWRDLKEYALKKRQFESRDIESAGEAPVPSALVRGVHKEAMELATQGNRRVIGRYSFDEKLEAVRELRGLRQAEPSRSVLREILLAARDSIETA